MMDQTYIVAFVFAGIIVAGVLALAAVAYGAYLRIKYPAPKPTDWEAKWEDEWEEIDKNLSK